MSTTDPSVTDDDALEREWADYRKTYGFPAEHMTTAHTAFIAGWDAARAVGRDAR